MIYSSQLPTMSDSIETDPLRIALLIECDYSYPAGAEMVLLHLARDLRAMGHYVVTVGPVSPDGWLGPQLRSEGFTHLNFKLRAPIDPLCALDLARQLSEHQINVVHSHEFTMGFYGTVAAGLIGARSIVTMHGGREYAGRGRRRMAMRWALRHSHHAVAVSEATREDLLETLSMGPHEVSVVANGIPQVEGDPSAAREELGTPADKQVVLTVGRVLPVKAHNLLVEAVGALLEEEPDRDFELWIAGDGPEMGALKAQIEQAGLSGVVRPLGARRDIPDLLAAADLFILPSLLEGMPLALIEAMLAEVPVAVSAVGGVPELIRNGENGILFPAGDVTEIKEALAQGLDAQGVRDIWASIALAEAEATFGIERMTRGYLELYTSR